MNRADIENPVNSPEVRWSWARSWRREFLCLPTEANPLRYDLDRDDQDCAWLLIIPLQVDLIAGLDVRAVHQFLRHSDLTVISDLTRSIRHVHMTQTTNICSLSETRNPVRREGAGYEQ
jgi:hypothetical protein